MNPDFARGVVKVLNRHVNVIYENFVIGTTKYCKSVEMSDDMFKYLISEESFNIVKNKWKTALTKFEIEYHDMLNDFDWKPEPFPDYTDIIYENEEIINDGRYHGIRLGLHNRNFRRDGWKWI